MTDREIVDELEDIAALFTGAHAKGQPVLIAGPPGSGKSRLIRLLGLKEGEEVITTNEASRG